MTESPCDSGAGLTKDLIMKEFKEGDKVYYPIKTTKVLTIRESTSPDVYPIFVRDHALSFTTDGKLYTDDVLPSIYHATPEMKAKLEDFYGIEFEAPPVKPTSKEIIKALLDRGDKYVACWVSDNNQEPDEQNRVELIYKYDEYSKYPYSCEDNSWVYATPFDIHTGEPITELPKGE